MKPEPVTADAPPAWPVFVTSDVHLGSRYCAAAEFTEFLRRLPAGVTLVLNGDIVDRWHGELSGPHREALNALRERSSDVRVVWVRGNHDDGYILADPGRIEMCSSFAIGKRLYVAHGYDFDTVMPRNRFFLRAFRTLHHLRIWLGAESVHVAFYAKKWAPLFEVLRRHVATNAIEFARENGYEAVACGHVHCLDDVAGEGVRYLNTGSWTETPHACLVVDEKSIRLVHVAQGLLEGQERWNG